MKWIEPFPRNNAMAVYFLTRVDGTDAGVDNDKIPVINAQGGGAEWA